MEGRVRKKTVLRTVRITSDLDELLQKDAAAKKATVNALIGSIFTRYAEWDRFAEKLGFVSASRSLLRALLGRLADDDVAKIGKELGESLPGELARFWFKRADADALIGMVALYCTYGGVGQYELETNGREYTVVVHHDLGPKWSLYLESLMSAAFRKSLGISTQFVRANDFLSMSFSRV